MPTGPGPTTLANPSPTPPMTAVPQSGPMTSRPRYPSTRLRASSSATPALSDTTLTCAPASSASIASTNAYRPGVETSATVPPVCLTAVPTVRGPTTATEEDDETTAVSSASRNA